MKTYLYAFETAELKLNGEIVRRKVKEFEIDLFPTKENVAVNHPVLMENGRELKFGYTEELKFDYEEVNFSARFELKDPIRELIKPRPMFHQVTIQIKGFIKEETKKIMFEYQEKGYFFHLQFRQRIYPKLIHEISFLTFLELKN